MLNDKLIRFIDENEENMLKDLEEFIAIDSVSNNKEKVDEALNYAIALAEKMGFSGKSVLDGQVGVIELGDGKETVGILAHVDVVNEGDLSIWQSAPFKMELRDGKIFGRGTIDDKGAIIASLYAMKAITELGLPIYKKIQLILGTQEEVEWVDMDAYVKNFSLPDYGFTPDGEFPLCNIEKGNVDVTMTFPIGDISKKGKYIKTLQGGTAKNVVPGACVAEIVDASTGLVKNVKKMGKAVHSCQPEKGKNAIKMLVEVLVTMDLDDNKILDVVKMIVEKFSDPEGSAIGLRNDSEYYNGEFVHRNIFTPTMVYEKEDKLFVNVNMRTVFGTTKEMISEIFTKIAEELDGEIAEMSFMPAVYVSKEKPFIKEFAKAYNEVSGRKNEFELAYGGSYAKAMPNIVSWGPIFPGEEDTCHEENEFIYLESFKDNAKIFASAVAKVALSDKSFK